MTNEDAVAIAKMISPPNESIIWATPGLNDFLRKFGSMVEVRTRIECAELGGSVVIPLANAGARDAIRAFQRKIRSRNKL
jgi:hypothetical protein